MAKSSEAQRKATKKWNDENMNKLYDHAHIMFPKGQKESIKVHAASQGESLNAFVNRAIEEAIERDEKKTL